MAKSYIVTGPLATPYREDGTRAYLYEGTPWPTGLRKGETERFLDLELIAESEAPTGDEGSEPEGYGDWTVADLKAEIERRNSDREEADQVSAEGKKAVLVAALKADDENVS